MKNKWNKMIVQVHDSMIKYEILLFENGKIFDIFSSTEFKYIYHFRFRR